MEQLEYRTFLLRVANDLNEKQFTQLKFVLKGCISSGTCEEIKEVCDYFAELERRQFLTPTKLGILKTALDAVGRSDLVEEIEKKEPYFTNLFSPKVKPGDNLEPKGLFEFILRHVDVPFPPPTPLPMVGGLCRRGVEYYFKETDKMHIVSAD